MRKLSNGKHRFFVRALADALADATPAIWKFKVTS